MTPARQQRPHVANWTSAGTAGFIQTRSSVSAKPRGFYFAQIDAPVLPEKPTAQTFDVLQKRDEHAVSPLHASPLAPSFLQLADCAVESQYASAPHDLSFRHAAPIAAVALHCLAVVSQYAPVAHS